VTKIQLLTPAAKKAPHLSNRSPQTQLDCVSRPISELVGQANNPRGHSARQIGLIAKSIEAFGFKCQC
jgi:hypothetical protein